MNFCLILALEKGAREVHLALTEICHYDGRAGGQAKERWEIFFLKKAMCEDSTALL